MHSNKKLIKNFYNRFIKSNQKLKAMQKLLNRWMDATVWMFSLQCLCYKPNPQIHAHDIPKWCFWEVARVRWGHGSGTPSMALVAFKEEERRPEIVACLLFHHVMITSDAKQSSRQGHALKVSILQSREPIKLHSLLTIWSVKFSYRSRKWSKDNM